MAKPNQISFMGGPQFGFSPSWGQYQAALANAPANAAPPRQLGTGQEAANNVMSGPIQNAVRASLGYDSSIGDMGWGWSPQYSGLRQQNDYARGMAQARQRDAAAGFNGFNQRIYQLLHGNDAIPSYTPMAQPTAVSQTAPKTAPAQKQATSMQPAPTQTAPEASAPRSAASPVTASVSPRLAQGAPKINYSQPSSTTKSSSKGSSSTGNHEVTSDYEGNFQPGDGYDWAPPKPQPVAGDGYDWTPPYQPGDGYDWTPTPSEGKLGESDWTPPTAKQVAGDGYDWTPPVPQPVAGDGYDWSPVNTDANAVAQLPSGHEVTSDYEGSYAPGDGYDWSPAGDGYDWTPPYQPGEGYDWSPSPEGQLGESDWSPAPVRETNYSTFTNGTPPSLVPNPQGIRGVDGNYVNTTNIPQTYGTMGTAPLKVANPQGVKGVDGSYVNTTNIPQTYGGQYKDANGVIHVTTPNVAVMADRNNPGWQLGDARYFAEGLDPSMPVFSTSGGRFGGLEPYIQAIRNAKSNRLSSRGRLAFSKSSSKRAAEEPRNSGTPDGAMMDYTANPNPPVPFEWMRGGKSSNYQYRAGDTFR